MNALTFTKAERRSTCALIALMGPSGSGKTYSAILMARGLVGADGRFGVIDTENERATYYDGVCAPWEHLALRPPFSPSRYIEAIDAAEKAGLGAVIIDSMSHEWEGLGGVCEMAEEIETRTGKSGLHCWNKPKAQHKKLMHRLMQTRMHVIFCLRSKTPAIQTYKGGKSEIVEGPPVPVCEKSFIYEMTASVLLAKETHFPTAFKVPEFLAPAFPAGKVITSEAGALIRQWCEAGKPVDEHAESVLRVARDVAHMGSDAMRQHWAQIKKDHPDDLPILQRAHPELLSIAREVDRLETMTDSVGADPESMSLTTSEAETPPNEADEASEPEAFDEEPAA